MPSPCPCLRLTLGEARTTFQSRAWGAGGSQQEECTGTFSAAGLWLRPAPLLTCSGESLVSLLPDSLPRSAPSPARPGFSVTDQAFSSLPLLPRALRAPPSQSCVSVKLRIPASRCCLLLAMMVLGSHRTRAHQLYQHL